MRNLIILSTLIFSTTLINAQNLQIGEWNSHLNYTEGIRSEEVDNRIYCATKFGLFYLNKEDNTTNRLSKTDGFSEVEIKTMSYDSESNSLVIAYVNSNVDIVQNNKVYNAPEVLRKFISGNKEINQIDFYNGNAYLSTSFGIVVYDLEKLEVRENYSDIGEQGKSVEIYDITFLNDSIYAATSAGVRSASVNSSNLLDYHNWTTVLSDSTILIKMFNNSIYAYSNGIIKKYDKGSWSDFITDKSLNCKEITVYREKLLITFENKFFELDKTGNSQYINESALNAVLIDSEGDYYFTKKKYTLGKKSKEGFNIFVPNCQASQYTWDIDILNNVVYVSAGSINSQWAPQWNFKGVYQFKNSWWTNYNFAVKQEYGLLQDVITMAIKPSNNHLFAGSFKNGVIELNPEDGTIIQYNNLNSSLRKDMEESSASSIKIGGLAFDSDEKLWVTNFRAERPLSSFDGESWESYYIGTGDDRKIAQIVIDEYNQKWLVKGQDGGIIVFDETRSGNDRLRYYSEAEGKGNLPSENVNAIKVDLDGRIWIGTNDGIAVVYDPSAVFSGRNYDAQKIWVEDGDESGYLLANEKITAIAVDGANNKWIGSKNGVWYVNDDGTKIIYHFNTENSPLPDNQIRDIEVNNKTGEVFFGTDLGLVTFRNYATEGGETHQEVYAFPNPVRPGYKGVIAIKGLVRDANVKITDVAGNMVFETFAEGGQATWDGRNFDGNEVKTGIYLILSTDEDGIETNVSKLMIVR